MAAPAPGRGSRGRTWRFSSWCGSASSRSMSSLEISMGRV
uniref:Uncharacterized protein n=1 Tax=Arundo donax TaxID=35708 RepID=A0A0A9AH53_ARUDO